MNTGTSVNETNQSIDTTVRIFDEFYRYEAVVPTNEYDVVVSFLRSIFEDAAAAESFTVALFRIAEESKTPVLTLLQELQGKNKLEVTLTLAYYLNGLRSLTTLLGVRQQPQPYFFAARNIIV